MEEATHRAISHAQIVDIPIVIVHVSGEEALSQIKWAKDRGIKIFSETCPQYICLTEDDMKGLNMDFEEQNTYALLHQEIWKVNKLFGMD